MPFCSFCGEDVANRANFCGACGHATDQTNQDPSGKAADHLEPIQLGVDDETPSVRPTHSPTIPGLDQWQVLGLVGAIVLFVGVFMPIVGAPVVGSQNLFQNGRGENGTILIGLAIVSVVFVFTRWHRALLATGLSSLALLVFVFVTFRARMAEVEESMNRGLAGNPFRGLGDVMLQSVQLQWGWAVLVVGSLALVGSGTLPDITAYRSGEPLSRSSRFVFGFVLLLLLASGGYMLFSETHRALEAEKRAQAAAEQEQSQRELRERDAREARETLEREVRERQEAVRQLRIVEFKWDDSGYSTYLVGSVRNGSSRSFSFVQVEFSLLDKAKNLVGTASDMITSLGPGETWKFKALVPRSDSVHTARVRELRGTPE